MKLGKKLFRFYIDSSVHVSLAVVSLCVISFLYFKVSPDGYLLLFVFLGSITGYNFVKYAGIAKLHHRRLATSLKVIQVFSLVCFLFLVWSVFYLKPELLVWIGIFGMCTFLYAVPFLRGNKNLRSISGAKIFVISFVWAGVTVVLPFVEAETDFTQSVFLEFLQRFIYILVLVLPFEIRDLRYDFERLGTIPQRLGISNTKILGTVLLVVVLFLELLKSHASTTSLTTMVLVVLVTAACLWAANERQSTYYSSFWVEGIPILWLLILLLL